LQSCERLDIQDRRLDRGRIVELERVHAERHAAERVDERPVTETHRHRPALRATEIDQRHGRLSCSHRISEPVARRIRLADALLDEIHASLRHRRQGDRRCERVGIHRIDQVIEREREAVQVHPRRGFASARAFCAVIARSAFARTSRIAR
jgi:hypothetical protein